MRQFIQQHPVWFVVIFLAIYNLVLLLISIGIRGAAQRVVMEMVRQDCLEEKWAWKKYSNKEELKRIALGSLYQPSEPPKPHV